MTTHYSKIYSCLLGAAIGDAMGCPLESYTPTLLRARYGEGDFVRDYKKPLGDVISYDMPFGLVTDDFSVSYLSARHFLANGGAIETKPAVEALLDWSTNPDTEIFFQRYGGPSTRRGIARLRGEPEAVPTDYLRCMNTNNTNGSGMKAWIAGLFSRGNIGRAIDDAITMCLPTHDNPIALSGACAVAAAVARGLMANATPGEMLDAGLYGAKEGLCRVSGRVRPAAGPSIEKRIRLATAIGMRYSDDFSACITEMTDLIGTGLQACESIPAAFGYLIAGGGDVMKTILLGVNSGNDCDTTATMAGALAGALTGSIENAPYHVALLEKYNPWIHFEKMAKAIDALYICEGPL